MNSTLKIKNIRLTLAALLIIAIIPSAAFSFENTFFNDESKRLVQRANPTSEQYLRGNLSLSESQERSKSDLSSVANTFFLESSKFLEKEVNQITDAYISGAADEIEIGLAHQPVKKELEVYERENTYFWDEVKELDR